MTRRPVKPRLLRLEDRLAPAILVWDGAADNSGGQSPNNYWRTAVNWVGDVAPQPGDDLVFPDSFAFQRQTYNDFPAGTAFGQIRLQGFTRYELAGNAVSVANGVIADVGQGTTMTLGLVLGGTGGLTKTGIGELLLTAANTYAGRTLVQNGSVTIRDSNGLGAAGPGNDTLVTGVDGSHLGSVRLAGQAFGAPVIDTQEAFTLGDFGSLVATAFGSPVVRQPVTLAGTAPERVSIASDSGNDFILAGGVVEAGGPNGVTLIGRFDNVGHVLVPAGATYAVAGRTVIGAGTVDIDGTAGPGPITGPGILSGGGSVGQIALGGTATLFGVTPGGRVEPGGPGTVSTLTAAGLALTAGGTLVVDVSASGADRLIVNGPLTALGQVQLRLAADVVPAVGTRYRIVDNDGTDAAAGTFGRLPEGAVVRTLNGVSLRVTYRGGDGNDVELFADAARPAYAAGAGESGLPAVTVFAADGSALTQFLAYDQRFRGGVRVATADVTGDGVEDIITAAGASGGPHVKVFDGVTFGLVRQFFAYDAAFTGGVWLAAGDATGDGRADIVTGAGAGGGPHVKVFDGATGAVVQDFFAYDAKFTGGVTVAVFAGRVATGPGVGGGPVVRIFAAGQMTGEFLAFDAAFRGGVFVAGVAGPNFDDRLAVAPGQGGGPTVALFALGFRGAPTLTTAFTAFDAKFGGGVRLAAADVDGDGRDEILVSPGVGGGPVAARFKLTTALNGLPTVVPDGGVLAFDPAFLGGVYVG